MRLSPSPHFDLDASDEGEGAAVAAALPIAWSDGDPLDGARSPTADSGVASCVPHFDLTAHDRADAKRCFVRVDECSDGFIRLQRRRTHGEFTGAQTTAKRNRIDHSATSHASHSGTSSVQYFDLDGDMAALLDEDDADAAASTARASHSLDAEEAEVDWDAEAADMDFGPEPDFWDEPPTDQPEVPAPAAREVHSGPLPLGWVRHQVNHIEGRQSTAARHTAATMEREVAALWQRSLARRLTLHEPRRFPGGVIPLRHRWATAHHSHHLRVVNTVMFCRRCGKYAAWKVTRLRAECTEPATGSTDSQRKRMLRGQPPERGKSWPGGAAAHTERQVARVTVANSADQSESDSDGAL